MARKKTTRKNLRSTPIFNDPQSRNEAILQNILGASNVLVDPQSRIEAILQAILYGTAYTDEPQSRMEELLLCILNGESTDMEPISRNEAILIAKINGDSYTEEPQSRIEELLIAWLNAYIEKTVTGNPIAVNDAVAQNVMALIAELVPAQDLHGYSEPWPAGGGVNVINPSVFPKSITGSDYVSLPISADLQKMKTEGASIKVEGTLGSEKTRFALYGFTGTSNDAVYINGSQYLTENDGFILRGNVAMSGGKDISSVSELRIYAQPYTGSATSTITNVYFQIGSTGDWSPYSNICPISGHDEVTVTRTDEDGQQSISLIIPLGQTVYGGTVDIISGELTIDRAFKTLNGSEGDWSKNSAGYGYLNYKSIASLGMSDWKSSSSSLERSSFAICNRFPPMKTNSWGTEYKTNNEVSFTCSYDGYFGFNTGESVNAVEWLAENPLQICYELDTPITAQLTPEELELLKDNNIIQTDAGTITLTYKAKAE